MVPVRCRRADGPPRKLIATIGDQLAAYGPYAPPLWLPPLDEPIPLTSVLAAAGVPAGSLRWPLGEIDRPFEMRRDPMVFDAMSAAGNLLIHGGPKSGKTTALQTFILSAAALHSPRAVSFYCLDYGGGKLRDLESLAHVGGARHRWRANGSAVPSASSRRCCWPAGRRATARPTRRSFW